MNPPASMTLGGSLEKKRSSNEILSDVFAAIARWSLLIVVLLSPWMLASVYYWSQNLIVIALMIGMMIWWFETALNSDKKQLIPYITLLVAGGIMIGLFQMLPLPAFLSGLLLGRQPEIYQTFTGEPPMAPRISLFTEGTRHHIQLLLIAISSLLLASRYFRTTKEVVTLLAVVGVNGALLAFIGMAQKLSSADMLWTYSEFPQAFASFVNRNNGAGYLLMTLSCCVGLLPIVLPVRVTTGPPLLISREMPYWRQLGQYFSFLFAELNTAKLVVLLGTVLVASGVIASTSRGGSTALLIAGSVTFFAYGLARRPRNLSIVMFPVVVTILLFSVWVGFGDRLLARWQKTELVEVSQMDIRLEHWRDTWPATQEMGVLGSGLGTYSHVHRLYNFRNESGIYEYAENQFYQSLVEAGWPGLILFLLAWGLAFRSAFLLINRGQSDSTVGIGTMGIFLLTSQAVASLFDFGLYIPANLLLMAVLVGMLSYQSQAFAGKLKKKHWLRFPVSNRLTQIGLLILFGGLTATTLDLYRQSRIDTAIKKDLRMAKRASGEWDYDQLGLPQTTRRIEEMTLLLRNCRSIAGLNHLGDLWIHRFRLMGLEVLENAPEYLNAIALTKSDSEKRRLKEDAWSLTRLEPTRDYIQDLGRTWSQLRAQAVTREPFIAENVPEAYRSFALSRSSAPLQPVVHMRLGQLNGVASWSPTDRPGEAEVEKAIELAPGNPEYRLVGAVFYLQSGNVAGAAPHIKMHLELAPGNYKRTFELLYGRTPANSWQVSPREIFESMLPDDANLMFEFSKNWCESDPETQQLALNKTEAVVATMDMPEMGKLKLKANIYLLKGETKLAIETMQSILNGNPLDENIRFRLANLLLQENEHEKALEEARHLVRANGVHRGYNQLLHKIESEIKQKALSRQP